MFHYKNANYYINIESMEYDIQVAKYFQTKKS